MNQLVSKYAADSTKEARKEHKLSVFKVGLWLIIEVLILGAEITHDNETPDPLNNTEEGVTV